MRALASIFILLLTLCLTAGVVVADSDIKESPPSSPRAMAACRKFDSATAKADKTLADGLGIARSKYLTDLQNHLDAVLSAASLDDANWTKSEMARIKNDTPATADGPMPPGINAARARYDRAVRFANEDHRRSLDAARRVYAFELEEAKRTALVTLKDVEEANRIVIEIARIKALGNEIRIDLGGNLTIDMVLIHPGSFMMGSDKGEANEKPIHKVTLSRPFYIGKTPVTQEQWQAVMGVNPSTVKGPKDPVNQVSWEDCQGFLRKLEEKAGGGRKFGLPTEAQWEFACRAGSTTEFYYGEDEAVLSDYAWYRANSGMKSHPVATRKPNAWGLYDTIGNVWQWCSDGKREYAAGEAFDPVGPRNGESRVLRGGAWSSNSSSCRSAARESRPPDYKFNDLGFRVVMDPSE